MSRLNEYVEPNEKPEGNHVEASQLAAAVVACAKQSYGQRGRRLLRDWKLDRSEDLGTLIFGLVDAGLMKARPADSPADFDGLYSPEGLDDEFTNINMLEAGRNGRRDRRHSIPGLLQEHFGQETIDVGDAEPVCCLKNALWLIVTGDVVFTCRSECAAGSDRQWCTPRNIGV